MSSSSWASTSGVGARRLRITPVTERAKPPPPTILIGVPSSPSPETQGGVCPQFHAVGDDKHHVAHLPLGVAVTFDDLARVERPRPGIAAGR